MSEQLVIQINNDYSDITSYFIENKINKVLLVCDKGSIPFLKIYDYFRDLENQGINVVWFSDFDPNPQYESVCNGVDVFNNAKCEMIVAVGGGSAIDVAKCIKLYSNMDKNINYLKQEIVPNNIPFMAIPTTAGTGSEATKYAVIYYKGEKQSVTSDSSIPSVIVFDAKNLETLPEYQKKATMLDAMCHSIESYWSVNSTDTSKEYSKQALSLILENKDKYLNGDKEANKQMLKAANIAGKAINITQTTAGHAMCYKLTSLYGIAHGHAAALCVAHLWPFMDKNIHQCVDSRGEEYLTNTFKELAIIFGKETVDEAVGEFKRMLLDMDIVSPQNIQEKDYEVLKGSVNPVRLKNNPVELTEEDINDLYHRILED